MLIHPAALFGTRKRPYERLGCQISPHHVRSFRVVGDVFIDDSSVLAECNFIWRAHHPLFFGALDEVSTAFDKGTADNDEVRGMCDKEIALFNELGIVLRKGQREMVTLVPHAANFDVDFVPQVYFEATPGHRTLLCCNTDTVHLGIGQLCSEVQPSFLFARQTRL